MPEPAAFVETAAKTRAAHCAIQLIFRKTLSIFMGTSVPASLTKHERAIKTVLVTCGLGLTDGAWADKPRLQQPLDEVGVMLAIVRQGKQFDLSNGELVSRARFPLTRQVKRTNNAS